MLFLRIRITKLIIDFGAKRIGFVISVGFEINIESAKFKRDVEFVAFKITIKFIKDTEFIKGTGFKKGIKFVAFKRGVKFEKGFTDFIINALKAKSLFINFLIS